jgi:salicylate synthetase
MPGSSSAPPVPGGVAFGTMSSPVALRDEVPLTAGLRSAVEGARLAVRRVLDGTDDRLLVITGPCSIHDRVSALEFAELLYGASRELCDDLVVVMRTYWEKARTVAGWPGLATAPEPGGTADPDRGFRLARSIMAEIVAAGLPAGTEFVSQAATVYLGDLAAWGCIGARTVESQVHRQMASGLPMPVGMKNRTDGCVQVAADAIQAAARPHAFVGVAPDGAVAVIRTEGNDDCHLVLRGGASGPNYDARSVRMAQQCLRAADLPVRLAVDASHGNSGKDHRRQLAVARALADQVAGDQTAIRGVMLESFLVAGRQEPADSRSLVSGQSVTDACMDWPDTQRELSAAVRARRLRRRSSRPPDQAGRASCASETLAIDGEPAAWAAAVADAGLFDRFVVYERDGTWTVAGGALGQATLDSIHVHREWDGRPWAAQPWTSRPLCRLGEALDAFPAQDWTAYGWVAFEAGHAAPPRDGTLACMIIPRTRIQISAGSATITSDDSDLRARVRTLLSGAPPVWPGRPVTVDIARDGSRYRRAVADAVRQIHRGAFQKVILSRVVPVDATVDVPGSYLRGRRANTPARSFLLNLGGMRAFGFCPETVIEVSADGTVSAQPLAGTRARGFGVQRDHALRVELLSDPKEVYEHAVSVQLACAELSQVCTRATVGIPEFMSVKARGSVQHLASRVHGRLDPRQTSWHALEAVFPSVTASGIPKAAARQYIAATEDRPRGLYAGAVLTVGKDGSMDAGLVLRSFFADGGGRWLRAGAGIVGASQPDREYEETCEKLRSIAPYLVERIP